MQVLFFEYCTFFKLQTVCIFVFAGSKITFNFTVEMKKELYTSAVFSRIDFNIS